MGTQTATHISLNTLRTAIERYPKAKALILTHPTYYGVTTPDLVGIIELAHAAHIPVLVDEAHGAHFVVGGKFPLSALQLGADVVVQSAHKTLPALTMGSYIHIQSNRVPAEKINRYLRMLQSSSPSYLILASLDDARCYIETYSEGDHKALIYSRTQFIDGLKMIKNLEVIEVNDPLKLVLRVRGYSGYVLQEKIELQGIFCELADPKQVLLVLPLLKS